MAKGRRRFTLELRAAIAGVALLFLTGGTGPDEPVYSAAVYDVMAADISLLPNGRFSWDDSDPQAGPLGILVNIARQHLYVFRGGKLIGVSTVSTGKPGHRTPAGEFPILQKQVWHRSNLYSNAPMPYMQRLTWTGIALHAGQLPGRPASHGCIRMPIAFARLLFSATRRGDRVIVTSGGPSTPVSQPIVPTMIAANPLPPSQPGVAFAAPEPARVAVAYAAAQPRLTLDVRIFKSGAFPEADVSGGVHWGQISMR